MPNSDEKKWIRFIGGSFYIQPEEPTGDLEL